MTPTLLINNVYAVEVPEGLLSPSFEIEKTLSAILYDGDEEELVIRYIQWKCGSPTGKIVVALPPGPWQLIGTTKEVTEDVAKGIVERVDMGFKDVYLNYAKGGSFDFDTALESLTSLFASKGLDTNKNWVLVRG